MAALGQPGRVAGVRPPGCRPGRAAGMGSAQMELGRAAAAKPNESAPNARRARFFFFFFQRLDKLGRFGQIRRKLLSVRWELVSATWARVSSCWDFSAELLKGFLF